MRRLSFAFLAFPLLASAASPAPKSFLYNGNEFDWDAAVVATSRTTAGPYLTAQRPDPAAELAYMGSGVWLARPREGAARQSDALELRPDWKIHPDLFRAMAEAAPGASVTLAVGATEVSPALEAAVVAAGGEVASRSASGKGRLGVRVPADRAESLFDALAARPDVLLLMPASGARLLNDNASSIVQQGIGTIAHPIWDRGIRGEGQVIAILDTGLDIDSCFFAEDVGAAALPLHDGTVGRTTETSRRKVVAYNFLYSGDFGHGATAYDNQGHGTYVAGNAAGSNSSDPFGTGVRNGMAPAAQLVIQDGGFTTLDSCSDLAGLGCPVIDLTDILDQAVGQGADFHNNSWGDREDFSPQNLYTFPTQDMDDVMWRNPEFLVVCAAGNSGPSNNTVGSPSIGKNVLSIGATSSPTVSSTGDAIANFSSRGTSADGRIKPDLTAPGQTRTALSNGNVTVASCATTIVSGTSMASPVTAGSAALVRQYFTEGWWPTGTKTASDETTPSAALIKATLIAGAQDMTAVSGAPPNRTEGWGRINLEQSLYFDGEDRHLMVWDRRDAFTVSGASESFLVRADGNTAGGGIRIVLTWTDYPATPGASKDLVNDLNLEVVLDGTTTYLGNALSGGTSFVGGSADTRNNVECVFLPASTTGELEVIVRSSDIVQGPQGFALAITGDVAPSALMGVAGWQAW